MKRFVVDQSLGRLSKWLRILGFDTVYLRNASPGEIRSIIAVAEDRLFLTRNRKLSQMLPGAILIRSDHLEEQLGELSAKGCIDLYAEENFSRCISCNEPLVPASKEQASGLVPEYVWRTTSEFSFCRICQRVYWPGSHVLRMKERLSEMGARDPSRESRKPA